MICKTTLFFIVKIKGYTILLLIFMAFFKVSSQEENPYVTYDVPFQNLLKFNRFLINPTFSTVREDKSYINLFNRSQAAYFDDNIQNYFLSYSGRINDRTGLGLSLYNQSEGVISNLGIMANYAYGVRLSKKSNFTFGMNIPYYRSKFDQNTAITVEEDPLLSELQNSSLISFQPGFNISYGKFDFGVFAENLVDFNLKTGKSLTEFDEKTFSTHLQYAHIFNNKYGIFESGRLMPLARARFVGKEDVTYGGGIILDLPKLGWIQGGYDSFYGASAGTGFNLNRRLSLGYNFERGLSNNLDNLGVTHEISFAYSFVPTLTEDLVQVDIEDMVEVNEDGTVVAKTNEPNYLPLTSLEKGMEQLMKTSGENYAVLNELLFRLDSLETNRKRDMERRLEMVMRMVKREINDSRPDIEEKASRLFLAHNISNDGLYNGATLQNNASDLVATAPKPKKIIMTKVVQEEDRFAQFDYNKEIINRKFGNIDGVNKGHYIVANVFKSEKYLKSFMDELKGQGLDVEYFTNPKNGLKYVYLAHYKDDKEAVDAYRSKMKGKYGESMWIMHVDNERYRGVAKLEFED